MTIVAAVDNSEFASKIVEEKRALSDAFGEELHVLHVLSQSEAIDLERTSIRDSGKPIKEGDIKTIAGEIAEEAAESISVDIKSVGVQGDPMDEITQYGDD